MQLCAVKFRLKTEANNLFIRIKTNNNQNPHDYNNEEEREERVWNKSKDAFYQRFDFKHMIYICIIIFRHS